VSAVDEVAGLPDGDAVAGIARKVDKAQPQAIRDIATRWRDAAAKCGDGSRAVTGAVNQLDGAWEGASADAFTAYMGTFNKAAGSVGEALTNAAAGLDAAADALETAKTSVNSRCENLLTEVRNWDTAHPRPAGGERDAAIRQMCAAAADDVRKTVQTANSGLDGALNTVKSGMTIGAKFSTLPAPADQAFTPAPGRGIDWKAKPEPVTTTAQGGSAYSGGGHAGGGEGATGGGLGPSGGPPGGGGGPAPQGQVKEWIEEAIRVLQENGVDTSKLSENDIWAIIQHESGGNPHAINLWDSNARAGHPSKGLMQCIDSTFQAHKLPGHDDIYNPVDNIIAGVRYSIARYGSVSDVPGIRAMAHGGAYQGY